MRRNVKKNVRLSFITGIFEMEHITVQKDVRMPFVE